ncbi:MAG: hypothetical protein H6577_10385 [Lewinellaceae bacterium]|nr:hypothetical protein [Lewinellaceae bacterium]
MKLGYIIGLWLVLLAFTLKAQFSNKVHFRNISVKDGLSYPVINCILQDQKGFIWIGTQVGLNKYDSQKFKVYYANPDQPGSLSDDYISCLFEDAQERLWVGTMHGLNVYQSKTSTFKKIEDELLNDKRILAITGDQLGNNWVLTRQYLVAVNTNLKIVRKYYVVKLPRTKPSTPLAPSTLIKKAIYGLSRTGGFACSIRWHKSCPTPCRMKWQAFKAISSSFPLFFSIKKAALGWRGGGMACGFTTHKSSNGKR